MDFDFSCLDLHDSRDPPLGYYNFPYEPESPAYCTEATNSSLSSLYQRHFFESHVEVPGSKYTPSSSTSPVFDSFLFPCPSEDWLPSMANPAAMPLPDLDSSHPPWQPISNANFGLPVPTLPYPSLDIGREIYPWLNDLPWPNFNEHSSAIGYDTMLPAHGPILPNGKDEAGPQRVERSRKRQAPYRVDDHEGVKKLQITMSQKEFSSEKLGHDNNAPKGATRRNRKNQSPAADQQVAGSSGRIGHSPIPPPPKILIPPSATLDTPTPKPDLMRAARSIIRGHANKKDKEFTFVNEYNLEWWESYTTPKDSVE